MAPQIEYVSKTQHYLKVKKPLLERQRRARMNKCLDQLKELISDYQRNDAILRMDKAEMLEYALTFVKKEVKKPKIDAVKPFDSFLHGYMNAVNEVSRIMAATPGMNVHIGKSIMIHLGAEYNRLLQVQQSTAAKSQQEIHCSAPMSPASSGYHSDECDDDDGAISSPAVTISVWRPW